jgi:hypothetical protein
MGIEDKDYFKYFTEVEVEPRPTMLCPICNWETVDTENKSGIFTRHLKDIHQLSINEFLEDYGDFSHLWKTHNTRENRKKFLCTSVDNSVECKICGTFHKILSNTHLKTHGITQIEYEKKFGTIISNNTRKEFSEALSNIAPSYTSKAEIEIRDYITTLNCGEILSNTKSVIHPFELDIFVRDRNIGIEYNGLYWHSENAGDRNRFYHKNKTELATKNGIRLIQIFEDEWKTKQNVIKSKLANIFGGGQLKAIGARECEISTIDSKTKNEFLDTNHIQGKDNSSIYYGLLYDDRLISVISFSPKRKILGQSKTDGEYELVRFATDINFNCVGAFSKLLTHFIRNHSPKKIITYADMRFTDKSKNVYSKNGFSLVSESLPNYFYMENYTKRLHRYNFTKHSLVKKGHDPEMTEWEIMQSLGYDRIWDCGHLRYELVV